MAKVKQSDGQSKKARHKTAALSASGGPKIPSGQDVAPAGAATGAVDLLKQDHRKVEALFEAFAGTTDANRQHQLARQICRELMIHALIEEEIFYRACRSSAEDEEEAVDALDEAQVEHDSAKLLINEILQGHPEDPFWKAKLCVLRDQIEHHVEEEERPDDGVMARAQAAGLDTAELAARLKGRKSELLQRPDDVRPARTLSLAQPSDSERARSAWPDAQPWRRREREHVAWRAAGYDDDFIDRDSVREDPEDAERRGRGPAEASWRGWQHRR